MIDTCTNEYINKVKSTPDTDTSLFKNINGTTIESVIFEISPKMNTCCSNEQEYTHIKKHQYLLQTLTSRVGL